MRKGDWMQTYTGRQFWPIDPRPEDIFIEDIAHALSMACRYAGHCLRFYSVAEHSYLLAEWFLNRGDEHNARWALLHDASEAYIVDVPRPLKPFLPNYRETEDRVMSAVCARFGLPAVMPSAVKEADNRILLDEKAQNMANCSTPWNVPGDPLGVQLRFLQPHQGEQDFLSMADELGLTGRLALKENQ